MGISDLCNDLVRFEPLNVHLDGRGGNSFGALLSLSVDFPRKLFYF